MFDPNTDANDVQDVFSAAVTAVTAFRTKPLDTLLNKPEYDPLLKEIPGGTARLGPQAKKLDDLLTRSSIEEARLRTGISRGLTADMNRRCKELYDKTRQTAETLHEARVKIFDDVIKAITAEPDTDTTIPGDKKTALIAELKKLKDLEKTHRDETAKRIDAHEKETHATLQRAQNEQGPKFNIDKGIALQGENWGDRLNPGETKKITFPSTNRGVDISRDKSGIYSLNLGQRGQKLKSVLAIFGNLLALNPLKAKDNLLGMFKKESVPLEEDALKTVALLASQSTSLGKPVQISGKGLFEEQVNLAILLVNTHHRPITFGANMEQLIAQRYGAPSMSGILDPSKFNQALKELKIIRYLEDASQQLIEREKKMDERTQKGLGELDKPLTGEETGPSHARIIT